MQAPVWFYMKGQQYPWLSPRLPRHLRRLSLSVPTPTRALVRERARALDPLVAALVENPAIADALALYRESVRQPPVVVLSTGRCGTLALHRFLARSSALAPQHGPFAVRSQTQTGIVNEVFYRMLLGAYREERCAELVLHLLGGLSLDMLRAGRAGRQFVCCKHGLNAWAPLIARLFPESRFVHLHRNPRDVFLSFYVKCQYIGQLQPLYVDPKMRSRAFIAVPAAWRETRKIAWYINAVEAAASGGLDTLDPARHVRIAAEDLYAGVPAAFDALKSVLAPNDLTLDDFRANYAMRINDKNEERHRKLSPRRIERLLASFDADLEGFRRAGGTAPAAAGDRRVPAPER